MEIILVSFNPLTRMCVFETGSRKMENKQRVSIPLRGCVSLRPDAPYAQCQRGDTWFQSPYEDVCL